MLSLDKFTLAALEATAAATAAYLDTCDSGAAGEQLDPGYYRACGELLTSLFQLVDAERDFPALLLRSPAAREVADAVLCARQIMAAGRAAPS